MKTGKLAESALKRSVLKITNQYGKNANGGAAVGADCAVFAVPNGQVLAWCAQEAAVAGQAGAEEMALLVCKCVNNLACAGAKPVSAQICMMLPEETQEPYVKELMLSAAKACQSYGMTIDGGDTNVSSQVEATIVTITAIGVVGNDSACSLKQAAPGQDIIITKWIGLEGTAFLAKRCREVLLKRYPAYLVDTAAEFDKFLSVLPEAEIAALNGAKAMHDMSQGGVFGALWELAEGTGLGLTVDLKKLPIRQETVEVCEVCNVNPYEMRSCGSLIMTCEDGPGMVAALEQAGIPAVVVGRLTDSKDRVIVNEEEIRFLDRPRGVDVIMESLGTENKDC